MRLSVLDQSIVASGCSPAKAIRDTAALAKACDDFGYHRFWVAEHHGCDGLAGSAPEVLAAALAVSTRRIRIGSAAKILPHSSPLKTAEQFAVLDALAPGRIDLGIGRGPGADRPTAYALNPAALDSPLGTLGFDRFPQDVADLLHLSLGKGFAQDHPFAGVRAIPAREAATGRNGPQPWMVGATPYTAALAGSLGISYCFAHFLADGAGGDEAVEAYRTSFVPGPFRDTPCLAVCAFAMAAPSEAKAEALFLAYAGWRIARDARRFVALGPPRDEPSAPDAGVETLRARSMFGLPEAVVVDLRRLLRTYDADEIVIQVPAHARHDRIAACRLIAEAAAADDLPEAWLAGGASGVRFAKEMSRESSQ